MNMDELNNNDKNIKQDKLAIITAVLAVLLILIGLLINSIILKNKKENVIPEENTSTQYMEKDSSIHNIEKQNTLQEKINTVQKTEALVNEDTPVEIGNNTNNSIKVVEPDNADDWIPFSVKYYGEPSDYIESVYTVTNIEGLAYNKNNVAKLKHTIYGSIAGLNGTYELEVSYDVATKLEIGTAFKIWYNTINIGNVTYIADIKTSN